MTSNQLFKKDLTQFCENPTLFLDSNPGHDTLSLLLNYAIVFEDIQMMERIIENIETRHLNKIPQILTFVDSTGYDIISSVLCSGNDKIVRLVIGLIKKIDYPVEKIECSQNILRRFDTYLRCFQFDETSQFDVKYLVDNFVSPFYTSGSTFDIHLLLNIY
jgi:hypothetical protein